MKVYIATPMYGGWCALPYAQSLLDAVRGLKRDGIEARVDFVANESLIQRARNLMAHHFFHDASDCTHLLFVDADIGFDYAELRRLLDQSARWENDAAVLTGVYAKKCVNWDRVRTPPVPSHEGPDTLGLDYNVNFRLDALGTIRNGFATALDSATGFMLIPRTVLDRVYRAFAPTLTCRNDLLAQHHDYVAVFDCMICPDSRRYLSEDFSFIRRCQSVGIPVRVDLRSRLTHTGHLLLRNDLHDEAII